MDFNWILTDGENFSERQHMIWIKVFIDQSLYRYFISEVFEPILFSQNWHIMSYLVDVENLELFSKCDLHDR